MSTRGAYTEDPRSPLLAELSIVMGGFLLALGLLQEWANIASKLKYGQRGMS